MNLLVVQTAFLGDVILSTPVLTELRRLYPEAKLTVVTTPQAAELLRHHSAVNEVIPFDKRGADRGAFGALRFSKLLRSRNFDAVFSLHRSARTAVVLWLAAIPKRYGFREAAFSWLYTARFSRREYAHEVTRNLAILKARDVSPERLRTPLEVNFPAEMAERAEKLLSQFGARELVGLAPGSVWATKRWTLAGYSAVAQKLVALGYGVVVLGGNEDSELAAAISAAAGENVLALAGKTELLGSAAVVSRLSLMISNDTALLHLAAARRIPAVAVFCSTVPEFGFTAWQVPTLNIGVDALSCRPCGRHGKKTCPTGTHACQLGVTADAVVNAALQLLRGRTQRKASPQAAIHEGLRGAVSGDYEYN